MQHRQRGISFIGFIIVLAVVGFFLFLGMKIGPTYVEYYSIRNAVNKVAAEAQGADLAAIRKAMDRQMTIDYAGSYKPEFIRVQREGDQLKLVLNYEIRKPLIYNLDFVAKFQHSAPIRQP
jgi:Tfp pilus assembly protein FimT